VLRLLCTKHNITLSPNRKKAASIGRFFAHTKPICRALAQQERPPPASGVFFAHTKPICRTLAQQKKETASIGLVLAVYSMPLLFVQKVWGVITSWEGVWEVPLVQEEVWEVLRVLVVQRGVAVQPHCLLHPILPYLVSTRMSEV
jgi:hypothetical protein